MHVLIQRVPCLIAALSLLLAARTFAQPFITDDQVAGPLQSQDVPEHGTFWFVQQHHPPLPWNPFPELPVYLLTGTNGFQYLVDDSEFDYGALREQQAIDRALRQAEFELGIVQSMSIEWPPASDVPDPGVTNLPMAYNYSTGAFYLEMLAVTNNTALVALHGTVADEMYQLLSKQTLTDAVWLAEGEPFLGQDGLTLTTFPVLDRTNSLFLQARSWQDSDGSGLPDWWQIQHFGQTGVDPYGDPDGDGWVNLSEYRQETQPNVFENPASVSGVRIRYLSSSMAELSWTPGVSVSSYEMRDLTSGTATNLPPNCTSLLIPLTNTALLQSYSLAITAHYQQGDSEPSLISELRPEPGFLDVQLVRQGIAEQGLLFAGLDPQVRQIRVTESLISDYSYDFPVASVTNGYLSIPDEMFEYGWLYVQTIGAQNVVSRPRYVAFYSKSLAMDGRIHVLSNLKYLLRAAGPNSTLYYYGDYSRSPLPGYEFSLVVDSLSDCFSENFFYRNLVPGSDEFDEQGQMTNGAFHSLGGLWVEDPLTYQFPYDPIPPVPDMLGAQETRWTFSPPYFPDSPYVVSFASLAGAGSNYFGLAYQSFKVTSFAPGGPWKTVLYPGDSFYRSPDQSYYVYPQVEIPELLTTDYFFFSELTHHAAPGDICFDPNALTPVIMVPFGERSVITGFARQRLANGDPQRVAFLGQHFQDAFLLNPDGSRSQTSAGYISDKGEFFPVQPGPAVLVTKLDFSQTNQLQGECLVHTIKVQLDVNHDGVMELGFGGPDNTSEAMPFRFWVNNDRDIQSGTDKPSVEFQDCNDAMINWPRDLEDLARLWICGIPALTNVGFQVTLSWNVTSGNPAINLFKSCETNGGIGYLTDTNVAADQTVFALPDGAGLIFGQVRANTPFAFPDNYFTNNATIRFLFEGAGIGKGQLVLTISQVTPQGTNVIAQTGLWLDLRDVKDMFEHAHIEGVVRTFPAMRTNSMSTSTFKIDSQPDVGMGDAKQLIVLVHGWNNSLPQSEIYAQTMFKRLYWQDFQGRFASLRWPTLTGVLTYNRSEYIAFRSASGASAYFNSLRSRFPDYSINAAAHSMGNMVMMEALKLQAASGSNALNNYVLMEAAAPAHCYDTNASLCPGLYTEELEHPTPNTYYGYPGAINAALRGTIVNFFNTNDFALAVWVGNQLLQKPEGDLGYYIVPGVQPYLFPSTLITDPREIMSFCARPRTYAVGAQPGVHGVIGGTEVDMHVQFGFGDTAADHSGQYTRTIHQVRGFYSRLLEKFDESQP